MLLQISLKIYDEGGVKVGQEFKDLWRHRIEAWVWEAPAQGGQHARDFQLPPEQRPLLDDNPANDLVFDAQLIHEVNFSLDNDVDIVMEFSADIPDHVVLPTIALEKACMGHEFKVVEQFRDKSIVELRGVRARGVPWDARVLRHCSWWGIRAALLNFKVCLEEEICFYLSRTWVHTRIEVRDNFFRWKVEVIKEEFKKISMILVNS